MKEYCCSVSMTLERKALLVATTVWGISSPFVQVTAMPGAMVISGGLKVKLSIRTVAGEAAAAGGAGPGRAGRERGRRMIAIPDFSDDRITGCLALFVTKVSNVGYNARAVDDIDLPMTGMAPQLPLADKSSEPTAYRGGDGPVRSHPG